jgi:hypothetical protein
LIIFLQPPFHAIVSATTTDNMAPTAPTFPFMLLPPEIRDIVYSYAFLDTTIYVDDPKFHRSSGPNRPKARQLPALTRASRKIHEESVRVLAQQSSLIFNDYYNFYHLVNIVPATFAKHVRRISLKGDIVPGSLLTKFPALRHVSYQQLGNCFYPPLPQNGFNKQAMKAKQSDLVDLVLGKSPALNLLSDLLCDERRVGGAVTLVAEANVLSCHERAAVWIDVNARQIICRRLMGVHRLYTSEADTKS